MEFSDNQMDIIIQACYAIIGINEAAKVILDHCIAQAIESECENDVIAMKAARGAL